MNFLSRVKQLKCALSIGEMHFVNKVGGAEWKHALIAGKVNFLNRGKWTLVKWVTSVYERKCDPNEKHRFWKKRKRLRLLTRVLSFHRPLGLLKEELTLFLSKEATRKEGSFRTYLAIHFRAVNRRKLQSNKACRQGKVFPYPPLLASIQAAIVSYIPQG